jgi:hypothetical protein
MAGVLLLVSEELNGRCCDWRCDRVMGRAALRLGRSALRLEGDGGAAMSRAAAARVARMRATYMTIVSFL